MTTFTITITFKNAARTPVPYEVIGVTAHTYGFLELQMPDSSSQLISMDSIQQFTLPTANLSVKGTV